MEGSLAASSPLNIAIEYRWAQGKFERLHLLAAELATLKPVVIVAFVTQASLAAKNATSTIPIVMVGVGDPIGAGLVPSLARPQRETSTGKRPRGSMASTGRADRSAGLGYFSAEVMPGSICGIGLRGAWQNCRRVAGVLAIVGMTAVRAVQRGL